MHSCATLFQHLSSFWLPVQSVANDIPGVPSPTANEVGTPGGVSGLDLTKEVCANVTPNVKGDSRFAEYYLKYGNNFNKASRLPCSVSEPAHCMLTACVFLLAYA